VEGGRHLSRRRHFWCERYSPSRHSIAVAGTRSGASSCERTVNETQAEIIRRVFRAFAAGISPRAIARRLNEEGIPGPDGALWTDSTLRGHAARGTGLINNELYIGKLVWNRLRYIKDPATGRRVSRLNPRDKWITTEVAELVPLRQPPPSASFGGCFRLAPVQSLVLAPVSEAVGDDADRADHGY